MPSVPFKKCSVCGGKIPSQDPHSACLFCLGETHVPASCALCKSLTPQARKNRETRLKAAIYTKVFTAGAMSSVGASSSSATPLPTLAEVPTQSPTTRAVEAPTEPQDQSGETSRPPRKDKKDKHKKASKESRIADRDSSAQKGSASKSSAPRTPTSSTSKSGSTPKPSTTKTSSSVRDKSPTQRGASSSSKRPRSSSLDAGQQLSKRRRSLDRDREGSPRVGSDILHRRSDVDRRPSDVDTRPSDPRLGAKGSSAPKTPDTGTSRHDRPLDLASGSRPLPTFRHTSEDATQLLLEPSSPAGSWEERRSPTPMPTRTRRVTSPSPSREPEPEFYFDSETGRYYRLVPQEDVDSFLKHRDQRHRPRASSRPSRASAFSPRRGRTIVEPEVVNLESDDGTPSQAPYRPRGDSLSSRDDDYQSVNQDFAQPGAVSPSDDVRTFTEHVIKMTNALDIKTSQAEEEASDPIERRVHGKVPTPPAIPLLPSLEKLARRSWEAPASTASNNRKVESLYRIAPANPSWLFNHPKQNSAIVEGSQRSSTPKASLMPSDKEAKKIDALAKKAYFSSALGMRVANYNACMGAYIQWLMEKVSPLIPDLPDDSQVILSEVRDEAHSIGGWLITSARHSTDCSAKSMAAAIALRRHAWLRSSDLNQNARSTIEDMPFDEDGLFHRETDEKLNFKYRMRTAARKHAGPVVCNGRLEGRLFPCQHPGVPPQIPDIRRRNGRIQIQRPALRPIYSSSHLHQMHGTGDILPPPPRHEGLPLPRRLALRSPFTSGTADTHLRGSQTLTGPRTGGQPRKIPTAPHQTNKIHRLHPRLKQLHGLPTSRSLPGPSSSCQPVYRPKACSSKGHPGGLGSHGIDDFRHSLGETSIPPAAVLVPVGVRPRERPSIPQTHRPKVSRTLPPLVARLPERLRRYALFAPPTTAGADHRRIRRRMGSAHPRLVGQGHLVSGREGAPHQRVRTVGGGKSPKSLRVLLVGKGHPTQDRQHHGDVLPEQAGRHKVTHPPRHHAPTMGLVHCPGRFASSGTLAGHPELPCRPAQQVPLVLSRVETPPGHCTRSLCSVGYPTNRPVCNRVQLPLSPVLLPDAGRQLPRRCIRVPVVGDSAIRLSPLPANYQDGLQNDFGCSRRDPCHALVAGTAVVPLPSPPLSSQFSPTRAQAGSPHGSGRTGSTPGYRDPTPGGMEDPSLARLPTSVRNVIRAARKPATQKSYRLKWNRFLRFLSDKHLDVSQVTTPVVLEFLMSLIDAGLCLTSVKCYLSAICSSFHFNGKPSFFKDPLVKQFLKGCNNLYPQTSLPTPAWSLETVLGALQSKPFEPLATTDIRLLTWKTVFLVAITSARRAGELCALRRDQPFLRFHLDKVVLRTDITFLPKVVSAFHMCQDIVLPTLAPNPTTDAERVLHTLDVRRALAFYLDRTKHSSRSERLFQCYSTPKKGLPVSAQRLSKWVSKTVALSYELLGKPCPDRVRSHATRAIAASSAFLSGIPLEDICKAAVWSQPLSFIRHYRLDTRAKRDAAFGRAVLLSGLH
ncbi:uncharacterized protein LOC121927762 [Sceloporus undulatus]|uniref:uncharacterized protein LOC121927762 n=1 Tax=Sceloporus undulatus TaxID=8520 RepID=UPI001C4C27AD|nr:uncharacterized protein LOC121927762 [Sceloporus undulatus]